MAYTLCTLRVYDEEGRDHSVTVPFTSEDFFRLLDKGAEIEEIFEAE